MMCLSLFYRLPILKGLLTSNYEQSNVLTIPLRPTSPVPLHKVNALHVESTLEQLVPAVDIPIPRKVNKKEFMSLPTLRKLIRGTSGIGKTTEAKKWLHDWCHGSGPLEKFDAVFYLEVEKLVATSNLGEAVVEQCLQRSAHNVSAEDIENICQCEGDKALAIVDGFNRFPLGVMQRTNVGNIIKMIRLEAFLSMNILVLTTPDRVHDFYSLYPQYLHAEAKGLTEESVRVYITEKIFKEPHRRVFGEKLFKYLKERNLIQDVTSLPLLLTSLCQFAKWADQPTELGDLDTSTNLVKKMVDCMMEHTTRPRSACMSRQSSTPAPSGVDPQKNDPSRRQSAPPTTRPYEFWLRPELEKVAFKSFFEDKGAKGLLVSCKDFGIADEDDKARLITSACEKGLLVRSDDEIINPSHPKAAAGHTMRFVTPLVHQYFAATHFANLQELNKETFQSSLRQIQSIPQAAGWRNFLKFACGTSPKAARDIIRHLSTLDRMNSLQSEVQPDPAVQKDEEHRLAIDLCLDLNYESQSKGQLNDILQPLVSEIQMQSPTPYSLKVVKHLLDYSIPAAQTGAPPLVIKHVHLYGATEEMMNSLHSLRSNFEMEMRQLPSLDQQDVQLDVGQRAIQAP